MSSPRARRLRRTAPVSVAILIATVTAGCTSGAGRGGDDGGLSLADPERTFASFERAWRAGDLESLALIYAAGSLDQLVKDVAERGKEEVAAWYRRDAERWQFTDPDWVHEGDRLAYLRITLAARDDAAAASLFGGETRGTTIVFAFGLIRSEWRITGYRADDAR